MTDTYIGGPPQPLYAHYITRHSDRAATSVEDRHSPLRMPAADHITCLDRALMDIWRNDAGFSWNEIYLILNGLAYYCKHTSSEKHGNITTLQLIALYRHNNP